MVVGRARGVGVREREREREGERERRREREDIVTEIERALMVHDLIVVYHIT